MKKNLTLSLGILAIANEVYGMNNPQDLLLALLGSNLSVQALVIKDYVC